MNECELDGAQKREERRGEEGKGGEEERGRDILML